MNKATESGAMVEMPRYKCHKQVWALKIMKVEYDRPPLEGEPRGNATLTPEEKGYGPIFVGEKWAMKNRPQVGGYYVVYGDGYSSYSPADAFEKGYSLITHPSCDPLPPVPSSRAREMALDKVALDGFNDYPEFLHAVDDVARYIETGALPAKGGAA
ncbi:hypothetical protein AWB80_07515 [Caballeronia pedi]|uniref:Uncharacterized protein n=1 Tax=Caballeronia pedi TaxID=1777141 RepID=A0A158DXH1_9BURK|nr:hypothetical protein [Caballeronia pedi]SAK98417.1 hypothetical protein AWB80_07515 [Caballeronia pedi]